MADPLRSLSNQPQDVASMLSATLPVDQLKTSPSTMEASLATAVEQIHEILTQLTLKDAPSSSDASPQHETRRSSPTDILGASSSESSDASIGVFFNDYQVDSSTRVLTASLSSQARPTRSCATIMGHSELAELCWWTLEQVQGAPSTPCLSTLTSPKALPALDVATWTPRLANHKRGRLNKQEEKKSEDAPRLQMYASEYARHWSHVETKTPKRRQKLDTKTTSKDRTLEAADASISTGAMLDLCVTTGDEPPPSGYYRLSTTASGAPLPLPRKKTLKLWVKKECNWDKAAQRPTITALAVIFPDRQEFVPPGFCVVKDRSKQPANLAEGNERCFLVFRRSREGNPLTGLVALSPPEAVPSGYTVVERTPRNYPANLNAGIAAPPVFLAYRQRLANLEALRPFPLVQSAQPKAGADFEDEEEDDLSQPSPPKLKAYYATGGTTVASNVGRFHILDRSTHALLSPSSVANRLQFMQLTRRKNLESGDSTVDDESVSSRRDSLSDLSSAGLEAHHEVPVYILSHFLKTTLTQQDPNLGMYDVSLQKCLEAMSFIPNVEIARRKPHGEMEDETRAAFLFLQTRTAVLAPMLTACYTRHGGAALVAVEALTKLLRAGFFADDVDEEEEACSRRLTLLDLAVQCVCDVATCSSAETTFASCVEFVHAAVAVAQGQLNTRTIGYVSRFYLFVFYFGASIPSSWSWPNAGWQLARDSDDMDEAMLLTDPRDGGKGYLPGGAPQAAALAFKELISHAIVRLGKVAVSDLLTLANSSSDRQPSLSNGSTITDPGMGGFLEGIVSGLVGNAVEHVDRANYTQLALYQVHRSGGSELFWHDMINTCGYGLFGKDLGLGETGRDIYTMIFAVLANLVKVASGKMRSKSDKNSLLSRDSASKLLSLELILHFLEYWTDEQEAVNDVTPTGCAADRQSVDTLAFCIRRMVVPALLANTRCGLEDPQVFQRMMRIISELWCSPVYRTHCKLELGILIEHFALRMLQLGPQLVASKKLHLWSDQAHMSLLAQQVEVMKEMKNWFSGDPRYVIECFLNFDTDLCAEITGPMQLMHGTQWKIFQRLCAGLSNIAEQCGELIGQQILDNQTKIMSDSDDVSSRLSSLIESMNEGSQVTIDETAVREAARLLRKTSLDTISQIVKALAISAAASSSEAFTSLLLSWTPNEAPASFERTMSMSTQSKEHPPQPDDDEDEIALVTSTKPKRRNGSKGDDDVVYFWRKAIAANHQERLASAVPSSQESRLVALEIAKRKSLKKAVEYLIACNVLSPSPRDIANFLRINKESLDPTALGNYLSESGTGGAENEYWKSIRHLYVRAISFVGMNIEEGLRHFLTSSGFRLPGEAQRIDRFMTTFAACYFEDNRGDSQRCPFKHEDTVYLVSFAIIMLNTDLHRSCDGSSKGRKKMTTAEFVNNLRGAELGDDIGKEYLLKVYDSIESNPIVLLDPAGEESIKRSKTLDEMLDNVRSADSLLRGLAVHDFHFATINDFVSGLEYNVQDALGDLTRSCVSKTWHQWHGVINTGLETAHLDPTSIEASVDILLYAISLTVCLDMPTERAAFLDQLARLKAFEERRQGHCVAAKDHEAHRQESWYKELEEACAGPEDQKLWALNKIYDWMVSLKVALQVDVENKVGMTAAVRQLKGADYLLQDPARSFLRAGDMLKKSSRTGRSTQYRFYLFSDLLLYAKREPDGRFKIHEELPLHLLKVIDWFPPSQKNRNLMFEVNHPRKTFYVLCQGSDERKSWVADLKGAVTLEMDRKMKVEAARMAVYTR